jgi:hypothetical protein
MEKTSSNFQRQKSRVIIQEETQIINSLMQKIPI